VRDSGSTSERVQTWGIWHLKIESTNERKSIVHAYNI